MPFRKTSDDLAYIDIARNTLYTIILGNGEPITTNPVSFTLKVEAWNTVDMDEAVDPDEDAQDALNAALKVNMFTPYNVKSIEGNKVTFFDKLAVSFEDCPVDSYFTWEELNAAGLMGNTADAYLTDDAENKYRIPTAGELALLMPFFTQVEQREDVDGGTDNGMFHPYWIVKSNGNTIVTHPFEETIYLKNMSDGQMDQTHSGETDSEYVVQGESQMSKGAFSDQIDGENVFPVYALRFKGTSQYAAYRWETRRIASDVQERYLPIKIKALKKDDQTTTIDKVAQESFWTDGYIEFKFPAVGYYDKIPDAESDNIVNRGTFACHWGSSIIEQQNTFRMNFGVGDGAVNYGSPEDYYYSLRLVRVQE